jgi:hypothetical protein
LLAEKHDLPHPKFTTEQIVGKPEAIHLDEKSVRQMAARADCGRTPARSHGPFDTLVVGTETDVLVDKTPETMAAV